MIIYSTSGLHVYVTPLHFQRFVLRKHHFLHIVCFLRFTPKESDLFRLVEHLRILESHGLD